MAEDDTRGSEESESTESPRDFRLEIDPAKVDEAVRTLTVRAKRLIDQGRYTRVRIKYKGKPLMKDIPLGVFVATEAATFWYTGLLRALVMNLGVRAFVDVEFIHEANEKTEEGRLLYMEGEVEAAEECYRAALAIDSTHAGAHYQLGVLLRVLGRRDDAIEHLEQAAADPDHPDAEKAAKALERMRRGNRTL
jgi:tetratricopeptide (TPR) repeat protein